MHRDREIIQTDSERCLPKLEGRTDRLADDLLDNDKDGTHGLNHRFTSLDSPHQFN